MPEFKGKKTTNAVLLSKPSIGRWVSLSLYRTRVDDTGVAALCDLARKLEELQIASDLLTDASMPHICRLPKLVSLFLDPVPGITDDGVSNVAMASGLCELYLCGTQLSDAGIGPILNCQQIWSLCLSGTKVSDEGVSRLGELRKLSLLSLNNTSVRGFGLAGLPRTERMYLHLNDSQVNNEGLLAFLDTDPSIEILALSGTLVTDAAMAFIARIRRLVELRLERTSISDAGVREFIGHPSLRMLYVGGTAVSQTMVQLLKNRSPQPLTVYFE